MFTTSIHFLTFFSIVLQNAALTDVGYGQHPVSAYRPNGSAPQQKLSYPSLRQFLHKTSLPHNVKISVRSFLRSPESITSTKVPIYPKGQQSGHVLPLLHLHNQYHANSLSANQYHLLPLLHTKKPLNAFLR